MRDFPPTRFPPIVAMMVQRQYHPALPPRFFTVRLIRPGNMLLSKLADRADLTWRRPRFAQALVNACAHVDTLG